MIEHNLDVLKSADWILEIGPGAGAAGGRIIAEGPPETVARTTSATSLFLQAALQETSPPSDTSARGLAVEEPAAPLVTPGELRVVGARENNLKNLSVAIPHRKLTVVTGVSGSGKSTLVRDILLPVLMQRIYSSKVAAGKHKSIKGIEHLDKVIDMDQSPIDRKSTRLNSSHIPLSRMPSSA